MDLDLESKLSALIPQLLSPDNNTRDSDDVSLIIQIISLVISMDMELQPKPESELMSLVTLAISVFNTMDLDSQPEKLSEFISLISQKLSRVNYMDSDSEFMSLYYEILKLQPKPELTANIHQIIFLSMFKELSPNWELLSILAEAERLKTDDLEPEMKLKSLISQLLSLLSSAEELLELEPGMEVMSKLISIISFFNQITSLVMSMDLDSQPKPESKFMSLVTQIISVANSISDTDPQREIISLVTQIMHVTSQN